MHLREILLLIPLAAAFVLIFVASLACIIGEARDVPRKQQRSRSHTAPLVALILLFALPAHAATLSGDAVLSEVLGDLALSILLLIGGAVIAALPRVFAWLKAHTVIAGHAKANAIKDRFLDIVEHFVAAEMQTAVDQIKADKEAGKLSPTQYKNELATVKARVIANAAQQASRENLMADLQQVLGVSSIDAFASSAVEAILAQIKATPATSTAITITPAATPAPASAAVAAA